MEKETLLQENFAEAQAEIMAAKVAARDARVKAATVRLGNANWAWGMITTVDWARADLAEARADLAEAMADFG